MHVLASWEAALTVGMHVDMQGQTSRMPVLVKATVQEGHLHAFGRDIPLPIRGSGYVSVMYVDGVLRVLQNRTGAVTVQLRKDRLQELVNET